MRASADIFLHVRVVMGIVIGLGIARLLTGLSYFVQHPGQRTLSVTHLAWAMTLLFTLVHFWWWEFRLADIEVWTFAIYFFLTAYTILLFLLCTLLFPDEFDEYAGYQEFFLGRRRWFFGVLAASLVFDLIDTLLKGWPHFLAYGLEYRVALAGQFALCIVAAITASRRFHLVFAAIALAYQLSVIGRLFLTAT